MAKKKMALTCPRCGHSWSQKEEALQRAIPAFNSQEQERVPYLLECPECGGRWRYIIRPAEEAE